MQTAAKSRAEIKFNDDTLVRLGEFCIFSFETATREFFLKQGSCLIDVPKGRGETKVTTAAITAAITGSVGILQSFGGLRGSLLVEFKVVGLVVKSERALISCKGAFEFKSFDIRRAMNTPKLFKVFGPLPSESLITAQANEQGGGGQIRDLNNLDRSGVLNQELHVRKEGAEAASKGVRRRPRVLSPKTWSGQL